MNRVARSSRTSDRPWRSLRTRITVWYGAIIALCLIAYSVSVGVSYTRHVRAEIERRVYEDVELAERALVTDRQGRISWPGGFQEKQIVEEEGGGHWIEVWTTRGQRLLAAGTLQPLELAAPREANDSLGRPRTLWLPVGPVCVMTQAVRVHGSKFLVRAAVSELGPRKEVRGLWLELVVFSLTVLALGGLGGYVLARRALGPLARMAEHARRITAEQLDERLTLADSSTELDRLRDAFNDTLARLERSFEQLRRFTADASHELRTPLTALRSVGEVALRHARDVDEYREAIGTMLEEVDRLSRLSDELLLLARAESGQAPLRSEAVDLRALAREIADQLSVLAEERGQSLECGGEGAVIVRGDRLALRQAIVNLVDNAIKYSSEGTRVTVRVRSANSNALLEVTDQGPGIAPEHRDRIFERFYRIDRSRSPGMGGTGLGLSLVRWTTEAHGGHVELETEIGRGSIFRLVLPCEPLEQRPLAPAV